MTWNASSGGALKLSCPCNIFKENLGRCPLTAYYISKPTSILPSHWCSLPLRQTCSWNRPLRSVQRQMLSSLVSVPWHIPSIIADWPYKIETLGDHLSRAALCALKLSVLSDFVLFFWQHVQVPAWEVRGAGYDSERLHTAGRAWRIKNTGPHKSFLVSASAINQ